MPIAPRTMDARVIVTIPTSAHAGLQVVLAEKHLPLAAGELRSLIRMDHHLGLWFVTPYGAQQGLQREIGRHARLSRPSDHAPRKQINDDRQI